MVAALEDSFSGHGVGPGAGVGGHGMTSTVSDLGVHPGPAAFLP